MRSASIADWILRCVAGKEQAASMVGDLVEIGQQKGIVWFWLAVIGVVAVRIWRPALGLILATYSGFWICFGLNQVCLGGRLPHPPPALWIPVLQVVVVLGSCLCWATLYSVFRFGMRDRFVQTAFAAAALCVGLACGWWQPVILGCCIAGFVGIVAISAASRECRRALLTFPVIVAADYLSVRISESLFMIYTYLVNYGHLGSLGLRYKGLPHSATWFVFHMHRVIETLAIAAACEVMRRRVMSGSKNERALEDSEPFPGIS